MTPDGGRAIEAPIRKELDAVRQAAVALCWDARPVLMCPENIGPEQWWAMQTEADRRLHSRRARIAIETWEVCHA